MSYSGYDYTPYYPSNANDGRGPYPNSTGSSARYQSSDYGSGSSNPSGVQPQSSSINHEYAPQQQQPNYTPTTTSADRSTVSYSTYGGKSGTSQYQGLRGGYNYSNPSTGSGGTSALGNLAHASSLEQDMRNGGSGDNRSLQQIIDYNRSQYRHENSTSPQYGSSSSAGYGQQQADNSRAAGPAVSHARDSGTSDRRASSTHNSPHTTSSDCSNPTAAYTTYCTQPARPTSGQNYHARRSDSESHQQVSASPTFPSTQAPAANSASYGSRGDSRHTNGQERSFSLQPQYTDRRSSGAALGNRGSHVTHASATRQSDHANLSNPRQGSRTSISPEQAAPATVDPSHVFNQQEYQRRQAQAAATKKAAEAESARKAAEAEEETRKATEAAAALKRASESQASDSREEQMAAEMRLMIEKMREYKSKDPSLFSSIWEQVKKTQPAGSIPVAPPVSTKDIPSTAGQPSGACTIFSPSPAQAPPDGELPDLGRFPAQRRRRGPYKSDSPGKKRKRKSKEEPDTAASPQAESPPADLPIDPAIIEASDQAQGRGLKTPSKNAQRREHQVVYVSSTGPQAQQQADTTGASTSASASDPALIPATAPTPTPQGKTTWPENKKWDLAVAAKNILIATPVNSAKAKSITPEQILRYLNTNPSYEELCQMIESKGLIIERGHFARCLLEAVPGMAGNMQRPASPNKQTRNGPARMPPDNLKYLSGNQFTIPTPPKNARTKAAPATQMTAAALQQPKPEGEGKPTTPLTKQEQARKKNILDIVDLSQLSDDDMPPPPEKIRRVNDEFGSPQPPPSNEDASFAHMPQSLNGPMYPTPASIPHPPADSIPLSQFSYPAMSSTAQHAYNPLAPAPPLKTSYLQRAAARQRELINSEEVVRPIDESKARKRKRYNPKTIVRDVLIAAARHPTMQPLNYHLDGLRKTFKHVNDISDLSTFRWDLVDPGDPVPASLVPAPQATVDGNDADDEHPSMVNQDHSHTVVTTATSHSPAVAASATLPGVLGKPPKLRGPRRRRTTQAHDLSKSWMSSGLTNLDNRNPNEQAPNTPQQTGNGTNTSINQTSTPSTGASSIKRRGRPPGAKNKHPRSDKRTPSQSSNMASRPGIDTAPAKPSGLRNSIAGDGISIVVPSPSPSLAGSHQTPKRGRPRKSEPQVVVQTSQQSSPIHRVYRCLWEHCPAELHNLETLKKHVNKHCEKFRSEGGPFPCLWKGCGKAVRNEEATEDVDELPEQHQLLRFGTQETWAKHMDRRHVAEFAWKLGDGPTVHSDSEMSDYLSDSARRQVTPVITSNGRPDPMPLSADGDAAKVYHKAHGNATELDKAKAFMEAAERRRQEFGPGMDRTGATFVTKEMNALLDDSMGPLRKVSGGGA